MKSSIVSKKWLLARLYEADQVIVDCRFQLGKPNAGREAYEAGHIPGAVYLDLEKDLSAPVGAHGGRHPLPDVNELASTLSKAGIGNQTRVIAYDDQGGAMAGRLWWLLRYLGHDEVFVLDEGFSAWKADLYPVSTEQPVIIPARFVPAVQSDMVTDAAYVKESIGKQDVVLIDSREPRRYAGEEEPIDAKAGHIPGAINRFWKNVLNDDGSWKTAESMKESFADLDPDKETIVYCGSGVTATPNVLALHAAGFRNVKLYAGSWSDWISYEGNPVATGEE